ncbi:putative ankyrin repeat protein RF_0381 [Microplitis mediator]|uniref:putative ankyrin repeat protein RF_0381 n=1 Tax=Microplitis mediator TaxID=375433 RepID=UPI002555AB9A|nr:putative ankyrin repeat protein RF_0381 [Microplitis mediator]
MDDDEIPNKRQRLEKSKSISDSSFENEDSSSEESSSHVDHEDDDDDEWSDSSFDKSDDFEEELEDEDSDIVSKSDSNKSSSLNDDRLHTAAKGNDPKLLEEILKEGVDIDAPDQNGDTALHTAVRRQNILFVKYLLRYGADITTRTSYAYQKGYTPLHIAAELQQPDIANVLLTVKPDFTTTRKIRNKLFQFALWRKNFKLMNYLNGNFGFNSKCARKIRKTQSLISLGIMGYSHDMIKLIMGTHSDINLITEKGESALRIAVRKGDVDMLKLLLKNGASPHAPDFENRKWYSGFHTAAEMNRVDMMKVFLDHHFDKDDATDEGITALHIAVINKNVDLVKTLLSWNVNVNVKAMYYNLRGYTPLHMAVVENSLEIIKLLLDTKGIDIRATNGNRETALHIATRKQFRDIIEYLLKFHVDINAKSGLPSQNGYTPLHIAAEKKNNKIINILLRHGADINAVTDKGEYGIHIAVHARDVDVIQNFLSHGVDIDLKSKDGTSPLHIAVSNEDYRVVVFLLTKGANIDLKTTRGSKALDIAIECDNLDLTRILLNAGADINCLPRYPFEYTVIFDTFKRHVIKLTTANVTLKNLSHVLSWFSSGKKMEKYRSRCAKEVELLKKSKIGSSNISYYEILVKHVDQLARCAKNIDIIETLVPENVIEKFPLYGFLVVSRFIKGISRREMVKKVEPLLLDVLYELPPIVVGIIIDYLSDEDLKTISKSL